MIKINSEIEKIYNLSGKLKRNYSAFKIRQRGFTLNPGEIAIIECISELKETLNKDPMPSQISACLRLAQPTITPLLNKMEEKKVIIKKQDKKDRRVRYISVTELGNKMWQESVVEQKKEIEDLLKHLGDEGAEKLVYILTEANEFFDQKYDN